MDRREFAVGMPALLALGSALGAKAEGQAPSVALKQLTSAVFKPGPSKSGQEGHTSQAFVTDRRKREPELVKQIEESLRFER